MYVSSFESLTLWWRHTFEAGAAESGRSLQKEWHSVLKCLSLIVPFCFLPKRFLPGSGQWERTPVWHGAGLYSARVGIATCLVSPFYCILPTVVLCKQALCVVWCISGWWNRYCFMITIAQVSHGNQFSWIKHSVRVGMLQWEGPNL